MAKHYWDRLIHTQRDKALLAENLFHHVWCTQGKDAAIEHLWMFEKDHVAAKVYFDRGCQWLLRKKYPAALFHLKKSVALYESLHQPPPKASIAVSILEQKAKAHHALGLAQMGLHDRNAAEGNFYQAWKVCSASNDPNPSLIHSAQRMMENVLALKWGKLEAHCRIICIQNAMAHELEADRMYATGQLRQSLKQYQKCFYFHDAEPHILLAQGHVRCKMAMLYQSLGLLQLADEEWTSALSIYQHQLGPYHSRTSATMKRLTANHRIRNTIGNRQRKVNILNEI